MGLLSPYYAKSLRKVIIYQYYYVDQVYHINFSCFGKGKWQVLNVYLTGQCLKSLNKTKNITFLALLRTSSAAHSVFFHYLDTYKREIKVILYDV